MAIVVVDASGCWVFSAGAGGSVLVEAADGGVWAKVGAPAWGSAVSPRIAQLVRGVVNPLAAVRPANAATLLMYCSPWLDASMRQRISAACR